jgi:ligand-binding sensor domain-containing protein/two-component sensor histidine kinase
MHKGLVHERCTILITCCILMWLVPAAAGAQDYLYASKNVTVDINRSHKDVNCVIQDEEGFFWSATWNGLYRFDGYNTEHIPISKNDAQIKIDDMIHHRGLLYMATSHGLKCLRIRDRNLIPLPNVPNGDSIIRVQIDERSRIWWVSHSGVLSRFDGKNVKTLKIPRYPSSAYSSLQLTKHHAWVSSYDRKLFKIEMEKLMIDTLFDLPDSMYINNLTKDSEGNLYLLGQDAVYQIVDGKKELDTFKKCPEYGSRVTQMTFTKKGVFMVKNHNHFGHLYRSKDKMVYHEIPWVQEKPENTNRINLFGDHLMVSYRSGVIMVNIQENLFEPLHLTFRPELKMIETARAIEEDDKKIYLATYDAIYSIDKKSGQETTLLKKRILSRDLIRDGDSLWIATEGQGLHVINLKTGRKAIVIDQLDKDKNILICLTTLGNTRLLLGGYHGLWIYHKALQQSTKIETVFNGINIFKQGVYQLTAIDDHRFLVATHHGLFEMNDNGRVLKQYAEKIIGKNGLEALCFWQAPDGSIWTGTTAGLFHLSPDGAILAHLKMEDGLAGEIVATLTADRQGRLWAATYNGLSCIRLADLNIQNFRKENGLPDNEFNQASNLLLKDGSMILGTMNGFVRFHPKNFPENHAKYMHLSVSRIEKGDQLSKSIDYFFPNDTIPEIRIGKRINYVKLNFALMPVGLNNGTIFEYRIQDVHKEWIRMGQDPSIVIDNFRKGDYILEVRCITGFGSREIVTMQLQLIVEEYFFREIWFYALMTTLLLSVLILFLYSQLQEKKRIEEIRHELSQNLHDEMGTYLTTIGMNAEMLSSKLPENRNVESIRRMSRHAMDFIKDNMWTLDSSSDNALQLWDRIKSFTAESCDGLGIRCEFNEIEGLEHIRLSMKQKNSLLLIAKELINNAIKHGDRKHIRLEWINDAAGHRMIMNNHVGQIKAEGSGTGLVNVNRRIEELGGTMTGIQQDEEFFVTIWMKFIK